MSRVLRLWHRLTYKPFGCGCGKQFRTEAGVSRCLWKHALDPGRAE